MYPLTKHATRYTFGVPLEMIYLYLLTFLPILLYAPVLLNSNGFVWDDPWMIVDNPTIRALTADNFKEIFTHSYEGQYSPVNSLYYSLLYAAFGLSPFAFHVGNILIHTCNSLLVFTLARKMLQLRYNEEGTPGMHTHIAFLCAFLFCITTVQVEAVAWASASKVLMYAFFSLLSILSYLQYIQAGNRAAYWLCLTWYILSIGSKEQAIVLPLALLSIDYYLSDKISAKHLLSKIPLFAIAILAGILSLQIQEAGFGIKFQNDYFPFWQRLLLSFYSICQYIVKILMPLRVHSFYDFPMSPGEPMPLMFLVFIPVCGTIGYYLFRFRKNRELIWGSAFFLINIGLTLHILPLGRDSLLADRYCYLPCIGVFFFCSSWFVRMLYTNSRHKKIILAALAVYLVFILVKSHVYIESWSQKG